MQKQKNFNNFTIFVAVAIGFLAGFYSNRLFLDLDNRLLPTQGCNYIARLHQDYLIREYSINFSTESGNSNNKINQRASDLNSQLLSICNTNPKE